ncbi:MAG TPA: hypothetical protein VI461_02610, partial [Chitinophagaceae bacterium]|nr:hypothetical protein [Chitinophagaceae bacterium]
MKKLLLAFFLLFSAIVFGQSVTEVIYPRYIQGVGTGNFADDKRVPYACRMTLTGLTPNATYRFFNRFVASPTITGDEAIDNGQGNIILVNTSGSFTRITGPNLGSTINSGSFTTNASGSYTGWFITDPRESQTVFFPGNQIYWRIMLNDGAGGTAVALRLTATNSVTVLKWEFWDPYTGNVPPAGFDGAAITNVTNTAYTPKNFVFLYDNTGATGRPVSGSYIESDGLLNDGEFNSYADFYAADLGGTVDGVDGTWGTIIPANLANGIRNIRQYSLTSGGAVSECTDADGDWGGADGNTVNAAGRGYFDP